MTCQLRKSTSKVFCHNFMLFAMIAFGAIVLSACGGGQEADPLVNAYPVAYVKRPMPANNQGFEAALDPAPMNPNLGAQLIIRDAAIVGSRETTITPPLTLNGLSRLWEVKDLEFSDDGSKLLFAARLEPDPDITGDAPTWDIYEYIRGTATLRRVISDDITASLGEDLSPHYLLNGRIIFSSTLNATTRNIIVDQKSTISTSAPVTEGSNGSTISFKLHVMENNGTAIHQVSYGTSHDLFPSMMRTGLYSGKIIFSRWDTKGSGDHRMHLYMINPDGSNEQYIYGWNSHNTGTANEAIHFTKPAQLSDGRVLSIIRRNNRNAFNGGDLVAIDINNFVDNTLPVASKAGLTGPAQISLTAGLGSTNNDPISRKGRFNSFAPYYDGSNKAIVSYGSCYVTVPGQTVSLPCDGTNELITGAVLAPPRYYVGVYTLGTTVLQPLTNPSPDYYYSDVTIAQDKSQPTNIPDASNVGSGHNAILHLRSVLPSNLVGTPAYIRIYKHAYLDDTVTNTKIGVNTSRKMRELIGYAPIQSDGSVRVRVPGDVPLSFELVDSTYQKLTSAVADHSAWFSVRSGEERTCNGCHETNQPHGRKDAESVANPNGTLAPTGTGTNINPLIDYGMMDASGLLNYPECNAQATWDGKCRVIIGYNTNIHPLWVAKGCVACHTPTLDANGGDITPGHLNLTVTGENAGEPTNYTAYRNIISGTYQLFNNTTMALDPPLTRTTIVPGSATSSAFLYVSPGVPRFGTNVTHGGTQGILSDGEVKMITEWIDMGAQYQNQP
jgi:Hydrazine synthase alpha subunit middle domain